DFQCSFLCVLIKWCGVFRPAGEKTRIGIRVTQVKSRTVVRLYFLISYFDISYSDISYSVIFLNLK
ncbi:MAG TPA: hypothetical protein DER09_09815, partial [Prolixibacteraceae bacterium]|nr:hypothetical protein [Prolixibacteraceae bacterium]